ncbi:MAG: hypothetical protein FWC98_01430 [Bacteroidales bacterium]|nr:hypothetical protein [Bacteroidales bacterium]
MKHIKLLLLFVFFLFLGNSAFSQSSFLDLTIVETTNYNRPIGTFSFSSFESVFQITSSRPTVVEPDINRALMIFLNILQPGRSYIIQHEPLYYFVFQYIQAESRWLIMNASIGERNEAIFRDTFREAQREMFVMLQTFYNNIPLVSVREFRN